MSLLFATHLVRPAQAAEAARVVSGGEKENPYDLNLTVGFSGSSRQARIQRELSGAPENELIYRHTRQTAHLRADIGLLPDVGLFVNLPFVMADRRSLEFDRSRCSDARCVNSSNSTFLRDGILPGYGQTDYGLDANGGTFSDPSARVFEGPVRSGIEYVGFGLQWAIFNQRRVESEATWILSFESRLSLAADQRFDPAAPKSNTAIGPGYHQMVFGTASSRRFGKLEPYLGGYYMLPVQTESSVFRTPGLGSGAYSNPQHRAGAEAGLEGVVYENVRLRHRMAFELRGRAEVRFLGLAQAELWEPLTADARCASAGTNCRELDLRGGGQPAPHTGVTRSPSYGVFSGDFGVIAGMGEYTRFRGLFGLFAEQDRFLSDAASGYALIDAPGRRFRVSRSRGFQFFVEAALLF